MCIRDRHTNPGPSAKREIQGRVSSGGAASIYIYTLDVNTQLRPLKLTYEYELSTYTATMFSAVFNWQYARKRNEHNAIK